MIYFDALTKLDCEQIREWRNSDISAARTPFLLTDSMQVDFFERVVSDRESKHRFWAIRDADSACLGIAGLTSIEWENGRAEAALMIAPIHRCVGYGIEAFELIKLWGFARMRLDTIYACVYGNNPGLVEWWLGRGPDEECSYPGGKFWDGESYRTHHMTWVNK